MCASMAAPSSHGVPPLLLADIAGGRSAARRQLVMCPRGGQHRQTEPGGVSQGVRIRDGDFGIPGRVHSHRRRQRRRALHLGRFVHMPGNIAENADANMATFHR